MIKAVSGAAALIGGALLALYLLAWRGDSAENLTGLLTELTGVLIEVVLIALVVDGLAERRERRRWRRLHRTLATTLQRAFVDLMRVNYLFVVPRSADNQRRTEFVDLARFSLGDLRSQVESFTQSLDEESQSLLRLIESKLNYLLRSYHSIGLQIAEGVDPDIAYETYIFFTERSNWTTLISLAEDIFGFLSSIGAEPSTVIRDQVKDIVGKSADDLKPDDALGESFYQKRFRIQDELIRLRHLTFVMLDSDGTTNESYFIIDCLLLQELSTKFGNRKDK